MLCYLVQFVKLFTQKNCILRKENEFFPSRELTPKKATTHILACLVFASEMQ